MRVPQLAVSLLLILSISCRGHAQQSTAPLRDPTSLSILGQVVAVTGASATSPQSNGIIAKGHIQMAPAGISGPILWETQGSEFRYERPGPDGTVIFVSGHGNPAIADNGKVRRHIGHLAMTNLPPHTIVQTLASHLANSAIQISTSQQVILNGTTSLKISTVDTTDRVSALICKQDWYLDPNTLLPLQVEFLASEARNALDTAKMTYVFSNWQRVSGVLMPFQVATLFEGQQVSTVTFDSIQIGVSIPITDFDAPSATAGAL